MKKNQLIIGLSFLLINSTFAQNNEIWDLKRCIEYAQQENLQVAQSQWNIAQNTLQYEQSQRNLLPTASGSSSLNYNYGFSVNPTNNQVVTQGLTTGNFSVSGGLNLYSGGMLRNTIRQNEVNIAASQADMANLKNNIALNVAQAYLQVLVATELLENAKTQISSTKEQLARQDKLIAAGTVAEITRYVLESQQAVEETAIVSAENQILSAMLALRQSMNLAHDAKLEIAKPDLLNYIPEMTSYNLEEIYHISEGTQPIIKAADLRIRSSLIGINVAEGARKPTLSAFAQVNTRLSSAAFRASGESQLVTQTVFFNGSPVEFGTQQPIYEKMPFWVQIPRNFGSGVGLSLNVPIYTAGKNQTNVQLAEIGMKQAQVNSALQRQTLRQNIERAYLDLKTSYNNYQAVEKQIAITAKNMESIQKQIAAGIGNQTDFTVSKNNLNKANNDLVRAKYDFVWKQKILEFYAGKAF